MPELIKTNLGGSFWHRNGFSLLKNFTNNSLLFEDVFFQLKFILYMKAVKLYATLDTIRQNKSNFINSGMLIFLTCSIRLKYLKLRQNMWIYVNIFL